MSTTTKEVGETSGGPGDSQEGDQSHRATPETVQVKGLAEILGGKSMIGRDVGDMIYRKLSALDKSRLVRALHGPQGDQWVHLDLAIRHCSSVPALITDGHPGPIGLRVNEESLISELEAEKCYSRYLRSVAYALSDRQVIEGSTRGILLQAAGGDLPTIPSEWWEHQVPGHPRLKRGIRISWPGYPAPTRIPTPGGGYLEVKVGPQEALFSLFEGPGPYLRWRRKMTRAGMQSIIHLSLEGDLAGIVIGKEPDEDAGRDDPRRIIVFGFNVKTIVRHKMMIAKAKPLTDNTSFKLVDGLFYYVDREMERLAGVVIIDLVKASKIRSVKIEPYSLRYNYAFPSGYDIWPCKKTLLIGLYFQDPELSCDLVCRVYDISGKEAKLIRTDHFVNCSYLVSGAESFHFCVRWTRTSPILVQHDVIAISYNRTLMNLLANGRQDDLPIVRHVSVPL